MLDVHTCAYFLTNFSRRKKFIREKSIGSQEKNAKDRIRRYECSAQQIHSLSVLFSLLPSLTPLQFIS
jgi:hypothetical protein